MTGEAELRSRFDRILRVLRGVIDSYTALDLAFEEMKNGVEGAYADAALSCSKARQAFEDEMPTMDALAISLKDHQYKDPSWPTNGADDAQVLRSTWYSFHQVIEAGKSFAPDDLSLMRNLHAALERAREKLKTSDPSEALTVLLPRPEGTRPKRLDGDSTKCQPWIDYEDAIFHYVDGFNVVPSKCWDNLENVKALKAVECRRYRDFYQLHRRTKKRLLDAAKKNKID